MNQASISAQAAMGVINANVASIFHGNTSPNKMVELFAKHQLLMVNYCLPAKQANPRALAFVVTKGVTPTDQFEEEMQSLIPLVEELFLDENGRVSDKALSMLETFCPDISVASYKSGKDSSVVICFRNSSGDGLRYESNRHRTFLSFIPPLNKG